MDNSKDLVVAVLDAAVALAGLLLVFCGFLYSQADAFPAATTDDSTINKYKNAAKFGIAPFGGCLLLAWIAGAWLRCPSDSLLVATWWSFSTLLIVVGVYGAVVILYRLR